MPALRDDKQFDTAEINLPSLTKQVEAKLKLTSKPNVYKKFQQSFSTETPKSISDEDRCYSKDLNNLIYILILLCIVVMIMMIKAQNEEGLSKGMVDMKTENLFRSILNKSN